MGDFQPSMKKTPVILLCMLNCRNYFPGNIFGLFCFHFVLLFGFVSPATNYSRFSFVSFWFHFTKYNKPVVMSYSPLFSNSSSYREQLLNMFKNCLVKH